MNENNVSSQEYLTVTDVQEWLNISKASAYELTHRADFPVCRFGSIIRIPRDAFLAWIVSKTYIPDELHRYMANVNGGAA